MAKHAKVAVIYHLFAATVGSFYADLPQVGSVRVTLQYDMGAPLHSPSWLDGYQRFQVSIAASPKRLIRMYTMYRSCHRM